MFTPDKASQMMALASSDKANPEESTAKNTAVKRRNIGDSSSDADNFNLKTQATKTSAKSTPVIDKAEDSDESMIESCSSQNLTQERDQKSKVKDFDPCLATPICEGGNLVGNLCNPLSETNLRLLSRQPLNLSHLISLMVPQHQQLERTLALRAKPFEIRDLQQNTHLQRDKLSDKFNRRDIQFYDLYVKGGESEEL